MVLAGSLFVLLSPIAAGIVIYINNIISSPLPYAEMDLDKNGIVSFGEAEYTADVGMRKRIVGENICLEYFSYKDGLEIKTDCDRK